MNTTSREELNVILKPIIEQACSTIHDDAIDLVIRALDMYPTPVATIAEIKEYVLILRHQNPYNKL